MSEGDGAYFWRGPHSRAQPGGGICNVSGHWVKRRSSARRRPSRGTSFCPKCGAEVIVRAHNGGHLVNEASPGLRHVSHPCFTIGDGMSSALDDRTGDLFASTAQGENESTQSDGDVK
jgi:hypothetical protein